MAIITVSAKSISKKTQLLGWKIFYSCLPKLLDMQGYMLEHIFM